MGSVRRFASTRKTVSGSRFRFNEKWPLLQPKVFCIPHTPSYFAFACKLVFFFIVIAFFASRPSPSSFLLHLFASLLPALIDSIILLLCSAFFRSFSGCPSIFICHVQSVCVGWSSDPLGWFRGSISMGICAAHGVRPGRKKRNLPTYVLFIQIRPPSPQFQCCLDELPLA